MVKAGAREVLVARRALAVQGDRRLGAALGTEAPQEASQAAALVEGTPALRLAAQAATAQVAAGALRERRARQVELEALRAGLVEKAAARAAEAPLGAQPVARPEAPGARRVVSGLRRRVVPSA